jgi:hypothetical protein
MKRTLLTAGAVLALAVPALAQTTVIEKKTITKEVPESGTTISKVVVAPNPLPPPRAETPPPPPGPSLGWTPGHWTWSPDTRTYVWTTGKLPRTAARARLMGSRPLGTPDGRLDVGRGPLGLSQRQIVTPAQAGVQGRSYIANPGFPLPRE